MLHMAGCTYSADGVLEKKVDVRALIFCSVDGTIKYCQIVLVVNDVDYIIPDDSGLEIHIIRKGFRLAIVIAIMVKLS